MSNANPKRCHGGAFLTAAEIDKLIIATAAGRNLESKPFCEQDVEQVVRWARGVHAGVATLSLVLDGKILPIGVMDDGEIGFGIVDTAISQADAKAYRARLAQLQAGWRFTPSPKFCLSGNEDLAFILAEPEKASLRLAIQTGNQKMKGEELDAARMLQEAAEDRNDQILLASILVGDVVPIVMAKGRRLAFRGIEELPAAERQEHHANLRRIEAIHRT